VLRSFSTNKLAHSHPKKARNTLPVLTLFPPTNDDVVVTGKANPPFAPITLRFSFEDLLASTSDPERNRFRKPSKSEKVSPLQRGKSNERSSPDKRQAVDRLLANAPSRGTCRLRLKPVSVAFFKWPVANDVMTGVMAAFLAAAGQAANP
jgi:hypothetical protein